MFPLSKLLLMPLWRWNEKAVGTIWSTIRGRNSQTFENLLAPKSQPLELQRPQVNSIYTLVLVSMDRMTLQQNKVMTRFFSAELRIVLGRQHRSKGNYVCAELCATFCNPVEFSRQEYWRGLPFPTPKESSRPRDWAWVSTYPALTGKFFITTPPGKLKGNYRRNQAAS